jgi:hypothetical protein
LEVIFVVLLETREVLGGLAGIVEMRENERAEEAEVGGVFWRGLLDEVVYFLDAFFFAL